MLQSSLNIFFAAMVTAVATGFGVLPFLFVKQLSRHQQAIANAVAAGLMLSASYSLMAEGTNYSPLKTIIGLVLGLLMVLVSYRLFSNSSHHDFPMLRPKGQDIRKMILIIGVMTVHSAAEGISVGVSFGGKDELGAIMTVAIAIHNIPEGLAIALVMIPRGIPLLTTAGWAVFSSLPQPLLAVPAFLLVSFFEPILPVGLGLAAGAMIWMVFEELVPDALEQGEGSVVSTTLVLSMISFVLFQVALGH